MSNTYDLIFDNSQKFKDYFLNDENEPISYFPKFNSINIIVGANNSGKSRFMRNLMSYQNLEGINELKKINGLFLEYNLHVDKANSLIDEKIEYFQKRSENFFYTDGSKPDLKIKDILINNKLVKLNSYRSALSDIEKNKNCILKIGNSVEDIKDAVNDDFLFNYNMIGNDFYKNFKEIKRYYIPTLRSAHSLFQIKKLGLEKPLDVPATNEYEKIENDIFLHTYLKNYELDNNIDVFTGLHLYREILNSRNSEKAIRNQFEKFEKFLGLNFFDGKQIDIVAKFDKSDNEKGINESELILIHVDGDKETRKLYDLGDGIQALIVLMYKIFMAEQNSFIFIDEPELNLHPGMQRLFLEQICSNTDLVKKNLKYIISTHSNHFLDLTIEKDDVSIYSFSHKSNELNEKQFLIKNVNRGDNKLLKELGVNNSSVFMANCSIWVEGISDRNYIKAFLKSYTNYILKNDKKTFKSIQENIDFAFFEYSGSNIDHYVFGKEINKEDTELIIKDIQALAISNRIFLLADSDAVTKSDNAKFKRLKDLENAKTENFIPKILWNLREVENLLSNDIWKEILLELCNKKLVKLNKEEIEKKIDKALSEVNSLDFSKKYIGEFLEDIRTRMDKISGKYILNQSNYEVKDGSFGTIINKRELSELIFNKNFSWEILSKNKEIKNLTIEIYNFITNK